MGVIRDKRYAAFRWPYWPRVRVERRTRSAEVIGRYLPADVARRQGLLDHEPHAKAYDCAHIQPEGQ